MVSLYYSTARSRELQTLERARAGTWVAVVSPTPEQLDELAVTYGLDTDLLRDATDIYEAPRIETHEGAVYIFTRYCYPAGREVATEPLLLVYTADYLITVMRQNTDVLERLVSGRIEVITTQKTKTLMQILGEINRSYVVQLNAVSKQTLRIRAQMRASELSGKDFVSIIELEEDLNEFLTALQPQANVLNVLIGGKYLRLYEDDKDIIEDLTLSTAELIELTKSRLRALANIRQAYDTIATTNLNLIFKRLTSIAIFLTIPTIIGGLWGMNVAVPFADDPRAFWWVLLIILTAAGLVVAFFHRRKWF